MGRLSKQEVRDCISRVSDDFPQTGQWLADHIDTLEADLAAARVREARLVEAVEEGIMRIGDAYEAVDYDDMDAAKGFLHTANMREALAATPDDVRRDVDTLALAEHERHLYFGDGTNAVCQMATDDECWILIAPGQGSHTVGVGCPEHVGKTWYKGDAPGGVGLHFSNTESLVVVIEELQTLLAALQDATKGEG